METISISSTYVANLQSPRSHRPVVNQIIVSTCTDVFEIHRFYSYGVLICTVKFDKSNCCTGLKFSHLAENYTSTTRKYLKVFFESIFSPFEAPLSEFWWSMKFLRKLFKEDNLSSIGRVFSYYANLAYGF